MQVTQVIPFQVEETGHSHDLVFTFHVLPFGQTMQAYPFQNWPVGQTQVCEVTFQTLPESHLSTHSVPFQLCEATQVMQVFPLKLEPVGQ